MSGASINQAVTIYKSALNSFTMLSTVNIWKSLVSGEGMSRMFNKGK